MTKETPPEVVTIVAKLEVKLKMMKTEAEFEAFNAVCDRISNEVRNEMLRKLEAAMPWV